MYTPGLWLHELRPIQFSLVVDDSGVKYIGEENAKHLVNALVEHYKISQDWDGKKYCGLTLEWEHEAINVHVSMPGYVQDELQQFKHYPPQRRQDQPYPHTPPEYGANVQYEKGAADPPPLLRLVRSASCYQPLWRRTEIRLSPVARIFYPPLLIGGSRLLPSHIALLPHIQVECVDRVGPVAAGGE